MRWRSIMSKIMMDEAGFGIFEVSTLENHKHS